MYDTLSSLVNEIVARGLRLHGRLDRGESPVLEDEQADLRRLLQGPAGADHWPEWVGDEADRALDDGRRGAPYLGLRYALTCWLDELFILHSPWDAAWNERKLEAALYGSNDRAWRFWEQAGIVESRGNEPALEIFYLCTLLGFRGERRETPERLEAWATDVRARVVRGRAGAWAAPPHLEPTPAVPPLRGRAEMRRLALSAGIVLLVALPVVAFLVVRHLAS